MKRFLKVLLYGLPPILILLLFPSAPDWLIWTALVWYAVFLGLLIRAFIQYRKQVRKPKIYRDKSLQVRIK